MKKTLFLCFSLILLSSLLCAYTPETSNSPRIAVGFEDAQGSYYGSASEPSYTFKNDKNTGIYRVGADKLGIAAGGTLILEVNASGVSSNSYMYGADGSATTPGYSFKADTDNGMYRIGTNKVGIAAGGALIFEVNASNVSSNYPMLTAAGSASAPAFSFNGDTDNGLYLLRTNTLGVAAAGTFLAQVDTNGISTNAQFNSNYSGTYASNNVKFSTNSGVYGTSGKSGLATAGSWTALLDGSGNFGVGAAEVEKIKLSGSAGTVSANGGIVSLTQMTAPTLSATYLICLSPQVTTPTVITTGCIFTNVYGSMNAYDGGAWRSLW